MTDEPTKGEPNGWELRRGLDAIMGRLDHLVGTREYTEYQRSMEGRLAGLKEDIDDERKAREKDIDEIRTEQSSVRNTNRIAILTGIGTLLGGIALAILTHWTNLGGH